LLLKNELNLLPAYWEEIGPFNDIVLSSRIRLARNVPEIYFPHRISFEDNKKLREVVDLFLRESKFSDSLHLIENNLLSYDEKKFLRESNILTENIENDPFATIIIEKNNSFSIIVNDDDHFHIQVVKSGKRILECYKLADEIDNELNKFTPYAFSSKLGYLSSNPLNVGTGLKMSVFLHLPSLTFKKRVGVIISRMKNIGLNFNSTLGERNKVLGSIYHLSSKNITGFSENDFIDFFLSVVTKLVEYEDSTRDEIFSSSRSLLEDSIFRSLGILKYSKKINYSETMEHLSNIRLGIILSIVKGISLKDLDSLMVITQLFHLQDIRGESFKNSFECEEYRAYFLNKFFSENLEVNDV